MYLAKWKFAATLGASGKLFKVSCHICKEKFNTRSFCNELETDFTLANNCDSS